MKRALSIFTALSVAVILTPGPLQAQGAGPKGKVVIDDPEGDGNFINDQGTGDGSFGDFTEVPGAATVSDITQISFANDAQNFYLTIGTQAAPPAATGIGFRVRVNPDGAGGTYCLVFEAMWPGANNVLTEAVAHLRDDCAGGETIPLEIKGVTLVVPRKENEAFGKGAVLAAPQAASYLWSGSYPQGVAGPYPDTTKVGEDYKFVEKKRKKRR